MWSLGPIVVLAVDGNATAVSKYMYKEKNYNLTQSAYVTVKSINVKVKSAYVSVKSVNVTVNTL